MVRRPTYNHTLLFCAGRYIIEAENTISIFYQVFVMVLRICGKYKKIVSDPDPVTFLADPDPAKKPSDPTGSGSASLALTSKYM